ncbi:MAG TPA: hypothetical protein VFG95_06375 [Nitrospiria bacterium]|nr:hypothetical protein [Nitrospiria bacterium]
MIVRHRLRGRKSSTGLSKIFPVAHLLTGIGVVAAPITNQAAGRVQDHKKPGKV